MHDMSSDYMFIRTEYWKMITYEIIDIATIKLVTIDDFRLVLLIGRTK